MSLEQIGRSKIGWFGGLRYKNIITLSSTFWLFDFWIKHQQKLQMRCFWKKSGDGRVFYSGSSSDVVGGLSLPFAVTNICLVLCPSPLARSTHRQRTRIRSWTLWIPKKNTLKVFFFLKLVLVNMLEAGMPCNASAGVIEWESTDWPPSPL